MSALQTFLRESTWGYPIIAAIHALAIAWFGGTVLASQFAQDLQKLRRIGIAIALISGAVVFWLHPARYFATVSFKVKIALLVALVFVKPASRIALVIWLAILFASRGIAFF